LSKNVENSSQKKCSFNIEIGQGWPIGRSLGATWSIVPDFAFDKIPKKNSFQSIFQKVCYIKIVYELVGHLYSLAWMQYCGGHGGSVSPTFLDGGNIICPPTFFSQVL